METPVQTLQEASGDAAPAPARFTDPVAEVTKLLNPEPAPDQQQPPEMADQQESPPAETWDLKALAEKLGTTPDKLYDLKVAMQDGTEVTVSALKDAYRPASEIEKARAKFLEDDTAAKREIAEAKAELAALLQLLDRQHLTPELVQESGRQVERAKAREAELLLQRVPEWKDPVARAADWHDIRARAREFGYTDTEIALAEQGYADHRMVAMLRALARQPKAEPAKPAAKVAVKPQAGGPPSDAQRFGQLKQAVRARRASPEAAVAALLKGA